MKSSSRTPSPILLEKDMSFICQSLGQDELQAARDVIAYNGYYQEQSPDISQQATDSLSRSSIPMIECSDEVPIASPVNEVNYHLTRLLLRDDPRDCQADPNLAHCEINLPESYPTEMEPAPDMPTISTEDQLPFSAPVKPVSVRGNQRRIYLAQSTCSRVLGPEEWHKKAVEDIRRITDAIFQDSEKHYGYLHRFCIVLLMLAYFNSKSCFKRLAELLRFCDCYKMISDSVPDLEAKHNLHFCFLPNGTADVGILWGLLKKNSTYGFVTVTAAIKSVAKSCEPQKTPKSVAIFLRAPASKSSKPKRLCRFGPGAIPDLRQALQFFSSEWTIGSGLSTPANCAASSRKRPILPANQHCVQPPDVIKMPADGNCFFHAVAHRLVGGQLSLDAQERVRFEISEKIEHLFHEEPHLKAKLDFSDDDMIKLVKDTRTSGIYVRSAVVQLLHKILGINFEVWQVEDGVRRTIIKEQPYVNRPTVRLLFDRHAQHYDLLDPEDSTMDSEMVCLE